MSDTPKTPATGGSYSLVNGELVLTEAPTVQDVEVAAPAEPETAPEPSEAAAPAPQPSRRQIAAPPAPPSTGTDPNTNAEA